MNNNSKINSHESLKIGIILSLVGGILDAHTFLFRNGVFANTQTGNIVLLALFLKTNKTSKTLQCIISIVVFILGIILTELLKKKLKKAKIINYIHIILIIEIISLLIITAIPKGVYNTLVIVVVSFVCSLQTNAFKSLKKSPYSTTMCTGNLRSASSSLFSFVFNKNLEEGKKCFVYFIIILSFFLGALIGRLLTNIIFEKTLLVCSFLLALAVLILIYNNKQNK